MVSIPGGDASCHVRAPVAILRVAHLARCGLPWERAPPCMDWEPEEGPVNSCPRPQGSWVTAFAEVMPILGEDPQLPSLNKGAWLKNH